MTHSPPELPVQRRRRLGAEIWIVMALSLGKSGVYSIVTLVSMLTAAGGIRAATASPNISQADEPYFDLTYQLLLNGFALVPVVLCLYLLSLDGTDDPVAHRIGLDRSRLGRDFLWACALAAGIGIPGLGLYAFVRCLGVSAEIIPSQIDQYWWTLPILIISAARNAIVEEVIVVAFLMRRLSQLRWSTPAIIITSALIRGSYHLYQGFGMAIGNVIMGVIYGYWFHRTRRVLPLVMAHTLIDVVEFVGYQMFADDLGLG